MAHPLIVETKSNSSGLRQSWMTDILGACDQMALEGIDGNGSKKLELKILQAGGFPDYVHIPVVPGFLPGLRENHFSWECQKSY